MGSRLQDCRGFPYTGRKLLQPKKWVVSSEWKSVPLEFRLLRQSDQHVTYLDFAEDYYIPHCVFAYDSSKQPKKIIIRNELLCTQLWCTIDHEWNCSSLSPRPSVQLFMRRTKPSEWVTFMKSSSSGLVNPRTYMQIHTPAVVQGGMDGTPPQSFWYVAVFRKFCL